MTTHVLYGLRTGPAAEVMKAVAEHLHCTFQERESHYLDRYWLATIGSTNIKIVPQPDAFGDPVENNFGTYATLIYIDGGTPTPTLDDLSVRDDRIERLREG